MNIVETFTACFHPRVQQQQIHDCQSRILALCYFTKPKHENLDTMVILTAAKEIYFHSIKKKVRSLPFAHQH